MRPETIGPYRILETLREGGVSSVYKAVGPNGAAVALKVFSLQLPAPPAVIQLSHPNILQVIATGQEGDQVYLATELFAGTSLERLLEERRLTIPQSIGVLRAV